MGKLNFYIKKITGSLYQHNAQKLICNGTRGGYDKKIGQ